MRPEYVKMKKETDRALCLGGIFFMFEEYVPEEQNRWDEWMFLARKAWLEWELEKAKKTE